LTSVSDTNVQSLDRVGVLSRRTKLDNKFFKYLESRANLLNRGFARLRSIRPCDKDLREGKSNQVKGYRALRTSLHNFRRRVTETIAVRSGCDLVVAEWKLRTFTDRDRGRDGWEELYGISRVDLFSTGESYDSRPDRALLSSLIADANAELADPFGLNGSSGNLARSKKRDIQSPAIKRTPPRGKWYGKQCGPLSKMGPFCRVCGSRKRDHT